MAVKSYQAQAEGEISLSKGEKIKGEWQRGPGRGQVSQPLWRAGRTGSSRMFHTPPRLQRAPRCPLCLEEHSM